MHRPEFPRWPEIWLAPFVWHNRSYALAWILNTWNWFCWAKLWPYLKHLKGPILRMFKSMTIKRFATVSCFVMTPWCHCDSTSGTRDARHGQGDAWTINHDDVIKWKHFPHYWPFVNSLFNGNSPHKGQWRGALMFSLICVWIIGCVNNREAGDLRRYRVNCDVMVMSIHNL